MSTPSTPAAKSRARSDSWPYRIAALVVVLAVAGLVARSCGSEGRNITSERAVEIAQAAVDFTPDETLVRFLQQGIPPQPKWLVGLCRSARGDVAAQVRVVIVNARDGSIERTQVGRTSC